MPAPKKKSTKASKKTVKKTTTKKTSKKSKKSRKKSGKLVGLIIGLVIVLIIAAGLTYIFTNINMIVKTAIEKYGSEATQTAVRVQQVKISLKEGSGGIYGLSVGNPEGFEMKQAFYLGEASVGIDIQSLTKAVKVIDDIIVDQPEIFVEINAENKNNLQEIQNNLPKPAGSQPKEQSKTKSKEEPRLRIRHLRFAAGTINAKVVKLDKEYTLKMPSFEMVNIGGKSGGTPTEISRQIIGEISRRALIQVRRKGVDQAASQLKKKAESQLKGESEKAKSKLKGFLK